jgi:hypothetical protein
VNSISGNLALWDPHAALKKNQTKPKGFCQMFVISKKELGLWERTLGY